MRYCIDENEFKRAQQVFKNIQKNLGPDGAEIWELYLLYLQACTENEHITQYRCVVNKLARQHHPQFNKTKAKVLEMQATMGGIEQARKTYSLFITLQLRCPEVRRKMAELESKQVTPKI